MSFLIDGNNILHRCFHAMRGPMKIDPEPRDLVESVLTTQAAYLRSFRSEPRETTVVFDGEGGTARRRALLPEYKATRSAPSDTLSVAMALLMPALHEQGYRVARFAGYEADDVIATYATRLEAAGQFVRIITSDLDLLQCVSAGVSVINPPHPQTKEYRVWTPELFSRKYEFDPPRIADYKALCGDKSDNIAGVPGVGDVFARRLLTYGGIAEIIARPSPLPARLGKLIAGHEETALRNLAVTTLDRAVPVDPARAA